MALTATDSCGDNHLPGLMTRLFASRRRPGQCLGCGERLGRDFPATRILLAIASSAGIVSVFVLFFLVGPQTLLPALMVIGILLVVAYGSDLLFVPLRVVTTAEVDHQNKRARNRALVVAALIAILTLIAIVRSN